MYVCTASSTYLLQVEDGPVWAHVPHRVGRLLMPLPRRRMGLSSDEERALALGDIQDQWRWSLPPSSMCAAHVVALLLRLVAMLSPCVSSFNKKSPREIDFLNGYTLSRSH